MSKTQGSEPPQPASLLLSLQRDCNSLEDAAELMCARYSDELSAQEISERYASMRRGGVSLRQVRAAICKVCGKNGSGKARKSQMANIFLELDRRYFIVENARWEFSMLDGCHGGRISEQNAMFLFKTVQGSQFMGSWTMFRKKRPNPGSKVTWEEIEVPLCDILQDGDEHFDLEEEDTPVDPHKEGYQNTQLGQGVKSVSAVLSSEDKIAEAVQRETEAKKQAKEAEEKLKSAQSAEEKRAAENSKKLALERAQKERYLVLKEMLQKAVQSERLSEIEPAILAVRKEKVPDCSELIAKAEHLIRKLEAAQKLKDAIMARKITGLEGALDIIKKGRWEKDLQPSVTEANTLLEKLYRLEQSKRAVLELSQRVIAELKSYSQPPPLVHHVMCATFLLLGTPETETRSWQATQLLIGKTGRSSLKRKVSECSVDSITVPTAERVGTILSQYEFSTVKDTSLGCATFYSWADGMVEEVLVK